MLIHVNGLIEGRNEEQEKIQLNIPALFLDNNDYKVSVRSVYLESKEEIPTQTFFLLSDLVDKNPFNLDQEIYSFSCKASNFKLASAYQLREYKIQLKELHTSQFLLHCSQGLTGQTKIRILLEITRDVRIQ